jgi:hypothetical protein
MHFGSHSTLVKRIFVAVSFHIELVNRIAGYHWEVNQLQYDCNIHNHYNQIMPWNDKIVK